MTFSELLSLFGGTLESMCVDKIRTMRREKVGGKGIQIVEGPEDIYT